MKIYIQRKSSGIALETVDEFETMPYARSELKEYSICDPYSFYYISSRPCKGWSGAPRLEINQNQTTITIDTNLSSCIDRKRRADLATWQSQTNDEKLLDIHRRLQKLEAPPPTY